MLSTLGLRGLFFSMLLSCTAFGQSNCTGGMAGNYSCNSIDLYSRITLNTFSSNRGNDCWGWVSPVTNRPYILMGLHNGTAFVEVSNPVSPVYLGRLPKHSSNSTWRDIKVYKNRAFIVSEASGHGMQIFDLLQLDTITQTNLPRIFSESGHYNGFGSAHNMVINEASGFGAAVGTNGSNKGLHMLDLRNPDTPVFVGNFNGASNRGYTHDAQIVYYHGPDPAYQGMELAFMSDENKFIVANLEDKANVVEIANTSYPRRGYTHQGWLSPDHKFWYMNDELDERNVAAITNTRTLIWDLTDLDNPVLIKEYFGPHASIDHNLYTKGNHVYQANYTSGLRILDASLLMCDSIWEVAHFDSYTANNGASFNGSWSVYPYLDSVVAISNIGEGLFLVRPNLPENNSSLEISGSDSPVEAGAQLMVTSTFSNPGSLGGLVLKSKVPQGCTYVPNSASNGGSFANGEVSFPIGAYSANTSISRSFRCAVGLGAYTQGAVPALQLTDGAENSASPFQPKIEIGISDFNRSSGDANTGTFAWCAAPASSAESTILEMSMPLVLKGYAQKLSFDHKYDFRNASVGSKDGAVVEISIDGSTWNDLGPKMSSNGYDGIVNSSSNALDGRSAFTNSTGGYVTTEVDLSEYSGYPIQIRFRYETDSVIAAMPWCIDDIEISSSSLGSPVYLELECCAINTEGENASARRSIQVIESSAPLPVELVELSGSSKDYSNELSLTILGDAQVESILLYRLAPGNIQFESLGPFENWDTPFNDFDVMRSGTYIYYAQINHLDHTTTFSNNVLINRADGLGNVKVFPNPANNQVRFDIFWPTHKAYNIRLIDIHGKSVQQKTIMAEAGSSSLLMDVKNLNRGVYIIEVQSGNRSIFEKLILH